ncbi:hypothetical protein K2173_001101 [Erythroxylum novogranatense]|uniref:Telomere length regulation protein conserved domain-containing protein n=1 Tax=Erythroxylum novogranatense TaxID=1862640 RepID=A0AAV8SJB1_9ROSI|nr:hypothetical protein K2173_001101 [Erythroxylum novogranatense]
MESDVKRRRELDTRVPEKVGEVISIIKTAKHVDQVICALHPLAVLLFPLDSLLVSGSLDERHRDQVLGAKVPSEDERENWWLAFYQGAAFPTLARVLLLDVASNWLSCFPISAKKHIYDAFFINGPATEVAQALVPCLQYNGSDAFDVNAIFANTERLLIVCLLDNEGVHQMARYFGNSQKSEERITAPLSLISRVAQIVTSIPDKARPKGPSSLSAHLFFKQIAGQLLRGAKETDNNILNKEAMYNKNGMDGRFLFIGEVFARICRRGSSDVLLCEMIPQVLLHMQSFISSSSDSDIVDKYKSNSEYQFWSKMMEAIKDSHAIERMSEQLLHYLAHENVPDVEAYWTLWILFNRIIEVQPSVRSLFVDKFLLWKVFPICCLRWIIQFSVLECPPVDNSLTKGREIHHLSHTVQHLVTVWSQKEFVQSTPLEQQTYVTAAIGLCMEKMSKEELEVSKDVMHSILQGVSSRLESPTHVVRKMASNIALVFSKVIDPSNPLYLDDSGAGETIDWELGLIKPPKGTLSFATSNNSETKKVANSEPESNLSCTINDRMCKNLKGQIKRSSEFKLVDPDEIIDPATLNYESVSDSDEDDDVSQTSESSSDSSLQPYDLRDDDTDLKKNITQLVDVVKALRKSDDADGVEKALDVVEKLVRAAPDELTHIAADLTRILVQVRCSDVTVEGEEESAEEKRQRALIALLVTCPFKSVDTLNKMLYSPNVDISQRIMILDVMTEAAEELAEARAMKPRHQSRAFISTISETQPWFLPSNPGPPGASPWKEVSEMGSLLKYSNRYDRELPPKSNQIKTGKTRRWSLRSTSVLENQFDWSHNKFPVYSAAFMLPAMEGFDKKRHGVDLLDRDFIVLGKLIYMLGVCIKCTSMHPEASALAPLLLDMLRSREICHHKEAYVRRAVLFAASCVLLSLHPSFVASAVAEGKLEVSEGLEWIRTWALDIAESDVDRECYTMALTCLQLHAEMALQASRALESAKTAIKAKSIDLLPSDLIKGTIKIPHSNAKY